MELYELVRSLEYNATKVAKKLCKKDCKRAAKVQVGSTSSRWTKASAASAATGAVGLAFGLAAIAASGLAATAGFRLARDPGPGGRAPRNPT